MTTGITQSQKFKKTFNIFPDTKRGYGNCRNPFQLERNGFFKGLGLRATRYAPHAGFRVIISSSGFLNPEP